MLVTRGLPRFKVDAVANHADVAVGTIYRYFDSKDGLVAAARLRYVERWTVEILDAIDGANQSCHARLARVIRLIFEFGTRHADLHHVLFHQAGVTDRPAFASLEAAFHRLIAEGIDSGEFQVADAHAASTFIFHGLHGLLIDAAHYESSSQVVHAATQLTERTLSLH